MVPGLAGPPWHPPYSLGLAPGPHTVIALAAAALVAGTVGLAAGLAALRRGWAPDARRLVLAGCLAAAALAVLPPSGSADHLNYAAYGRIATLGLDPYVTTPDALPGDPIADAVEEWRDTPSVYGPVVTAVQALASLVGGESVRLTVFAMQAVNAAAFIAVALLLHRFTAPADRPRAALLWAANPLMIYHLAAGTHVDTLAVAGVVAALVTGGSPGWTTATGRRLAGAGAFLGLAVAVKVNAGLAALGAAWALRPWGAERRGAEGPVAGAQEAELSGSGGRRAWAGRRSADDGGWFRPAGGRYGRYGWIGWYGRYGLGRLVVVAGSALAVAGVAYALAGPYSLNRVLEASKMVSLGTPWSLVKGWLQALFGPGAYRSWIQAGSLALLVVLAWALSRALREPYRLGERSAAAPGAAVVVVAAWLVATPYALPWYDGLLFALLALVPATALDGFAVARLGLLSLGYLPARQAGRPEDLEWLVTGVRASFVPWVLLGLTVVLLGWAWRAGGRVRTPRASAAPRP
ncbi:polyprenol phosphomannose-dependent alpha 1,6 mannosyltransferase MptB [Thermopolyspora sp. NPDC052614]|uniref:polyprenol phosphomannose-dependent alpha 1,6 mannosyltransferase MptB n=1 Tax=Thermopolyspora sp. NPDC052614 TaxID=3155682 RepID=UPI003429DC90